MWALRAAVRPGLRLLRAPRVPPAPRSTPPPWPARTLAAARWGRGGREGPGAAGRGGADGRGGRAERDGAESEEEDEDEDEEDEELLRREPLLPAGTQRVCLVHPDVRWGAGRPQLTTAEWQVAEAAALVHTLDGWAVVQTMVVPTKTPEKRRVFGKGHFEQLTEKIRACPRLSCVFLNVERLAAPAKAELQAAWGLEVFDRFTLVLHVFRCNARTREARLQVALAEIPLLWSTLSREPAGPGRGGGSRYIMGSGESWAQLRRRLLREKEQKLRRALERLRARRRLLRRRREQRALPAVAVVGYTNCGKTTLIRALTGDAAAQPRDQLFATLDVTAHAGALPSRLTVLFVDTIGFLSQLPHGLIDAFSATLEEVAHADLIVHVRDVSHPESELQKASVLAALRALRLPAPLLDSLLEVHNKVDLVPGYRAPERAVAVSALHGLGLEELRARLEAAVLAATARRLCTLRVPLGGPELSWLHREAAVQDVSVLPEAGCARVSVLISAAALGRFRKLFPESAARGS